MLSADPISLHEHDLARDLDFAPEAAMTQDKSPSHLLPSLLPTEELDNSHDHEAPPRPSTPVPWVDDEDEEDFLAAAISSFAFHSTQKSVKSSSARRADAKHDEWAAWAKATASRSEDEDEEEDMELSSPLSYSPATSDDGSLDMDLCSTRPPSPLFEDSPYEFETSPDRPATSHGCPGSSSSSAASTPCPPRRWRHSAPPSLRRQVLLPEWRRSLIEEFLAQKSKSDDDE